VRLRDSGSAGEREEMLAEWLRETLGRVLKLAARKIDRDRPMGTMGLDSLMGVEFVRRIGNALEIPVPATVVFNYPTITLLARQLLERLKLKTEEIIPTEPAVPAAMDLPEMSEEEALQGRVGGGA